MNSVCEVIRHFEEKKNPQIISILLRIEVLE